MIYGYDESGHVTRIEYPAIKRSLSWEYNDAGLKTRFIDSEGRTVQYQYDELDRLTAIKPADSAPLTFGHDAKGRVTAVAWPNGVKGAWQFDAEDRPLKLTYTDAGGKQLAGWDYKYDAAGDLTETLDEGHTTRYQYDARGQLLEESFGNEKGTNYTYLSGGNRAKREAGGSATEYHYNESDQLLAAGKETFRYDANGNVIDDQGPAGVTQYTYDVENRLIGVKPSDGKTVEYRYAPTGERIARIDAKGTTYYVTDGVNLLAELNGDLKPRATYLHGPRIDQPLLMTRDGQTWCFHADRLGSIRRLTDSRGTKAADYDYDAFGQPRNYEDSLVSPFTYAAREFDAATGLYYNRRRYYDPRLGRFLAVDPAKAQLSEPRTLNPYLYAVNSPLSYVDPTGTWQIRINMLDPVDWYSPQPLPPGLTPSTPLFHFTSPDVADAGVAGQQLGWGPSGNSLHVTTLPPGSGARYPAGIGTPYASGGSIKTSAGDLTANGMRLVENTNPLYRPGTNWIIEQLPGQDVIDFSGASRGGPYFPPNQGGGGRSDRGGFLSLPDIDLSPAGNVAGPVGLTFLGTNLISDVLEGKPPSQIASDTVTNTIMGTAVGSLLTVGGTALGTGIGFLIGGPPGAIAGGQLGGGFVVGALLGIGAMGSGQRLGQDLGAASADAPVKAGPSPPNNWNDLPPPPFDLGLGLLDPQSWGYPGSNSGNMINPWSVFAPGSDDDILRRALAIEAQLGQNNGLGSNQRPYWASPQGNSGSGNSLPPNFWNRGANNQSTRQRQSQMQGRSQGQRQQSQSSMPGLQQVSPPPPLQPVPAFTPVQAPNTLQVQDAAAPAGGDQFAAGPAAASAEQRQKALTNHAPLSSCLDVGRSFVGCATRHGEPSAAGEIVGKVVEITKGGVKVAVDGNSTVRPGDRVEIFTILPDIAEEAGVAAGRVSQVEERHVTAAMESTTGAVSVGQQARIFANVPASTAGPPMENSAGDAGPAISSSGGPAADQAWCGANVRTATGLQAKGAGLPRRVGVVVRGIFPGTPLEQAALAAGDLIVKVGDVWINNQHDFAATGASRRPGDRLAITFVRNGERREAVITLTPRPSDESVAQLLCAAVAQGKDWACVELWSAHRHGKRVAKDEAEADAWLRKAADGGDLLAQVLLAEDRLSGRGAAKNDAEALSWAR